MKLPLALLSSIALLPLCASAALPPGWVYQSYDVPSTLFATPQDINNNGDFVGTFAYPLPGERSRGFINKSGVFAEIIVPFAGEIVPYGISDTGSIVGGFGGGSGPGIPTVGYFLYQNGTASVYALPASVGEVREFRVGGITPDGTIYGSYEKGTRLYFFTEKDGAVSSLLVGDYDPEEPPFINVRGFGGGLFGGSYRPGTDTSRGFLYDGASFITVPGDVRSQVDGINGFGTAVGRFEVEGGGRAGFVLDRSGNLREIHFDNLSTALYGINDNNVIVGTYIDPETGFSRGFIGYPVPEPSMIVLLALGGVGVLVMVKRRR